jgi:hypothetical protein
LFDLVMSEYGGCPNEIAAHWTPAQLVVMAEAIRKRRALRLAEAASLHYGAVAAALAGDKVYRQFRNVLRRLEETGGLRGEGGSESVDAEKLAAKLGLTFVEHTRPAEEATAEDGDGQGQTTGDADRGHVPAGTSRAGGLDTGGGAATGDGEVHGSPEAARSRRHVRRRGD